jgi:hypothetical protein
VDSLLASPPVGVFAAVFRFDQVCGEKDPIEEEVYSVIVVLSEMVTIPFWGAAMDGLNTLLAAGAELSWEVR